eukprot:600428-Amphidinium_carterae.1
MVALEGETRNHSHKIPSAQTATNLLPARVFHTGVMQCRKRHFLDTETDERVGDIQSSTQSLKCCSVKVMLL